MYHITFFPHPCYSIQHPIACWFPRAFSHMATTSHSYPCRSDVLVDTLLTGSNSIIIVPKIKNSIIIFWTKRKKKKQRTLLLLFCHYPIYIRINWYSLSLIWGIVDRTNEFDLLPAGASLRINNSCLMIQTEINSY